MPTPDTILEWDVLLDDREWNRPDSLDELMRLEPASPAYRAGSGSMVRKPSG